MKISTLFLPVLCASAASAFRIDLWHDYDYQGTQRSYVSVGSRLVLENALLMYGI